MIYFPSINNKYHFTDFRSPQEAKIKLFLFTMKCLSVKVAFLFFILEIKSCEINISLIEKFINDSNKSISFISSEHVTIDLNFIMEKFSHKSRVVLKFHPEEMKSCLSYANVDLHNHQDEAIKLLNFAEKNDFVIFTSSSAVELALKCFVHPLSRFLIIVIDESSISEKNLFHMLNNTWTNNGAFKVYIATCNKTFFYAFNPFHLNKDGSFGKLNSFVDFNRERFRYSRELNGYPIRLEIFTSTFNIPYIQPPLEIDDFYGPDINVAKLIGESLNVSCE